MAIEVLFQLYIFPLKILSMIARSNSLCQKDWENLNRLHLVKTGALILKSFWRDKMFGVSQLQDHNIEICPQNMQKQLIKLLVKNRIMYTTTSALYKIISSAYNIILDIMYSTIMHSNHFSSICHIFQLRELLINIFFASH